MNKHEIVTNAQHLMLLETEWYQSNGWWKDRLHVYSEGIPCPEGDWSWNRRNPHRPEWIEPALKRDGIYARHENEMAARMSHNGRAEMPRPKGK